LGLQLYAASSALPAGRQDVARDAVSENIHFRLAARLNLIKALPLAVLSMNLHEHRDNCNDILMPLRISLKRGLH
jgi:hypothetical protein